MNDLSRRRFEREDTLNLIDYVVIGDSGEKTARRMGRTLNVSEEGLLLDTHTPLDEGDTILISAALDEDIIELKGKVVHIRTSRENSYHVGVEFMEIDSASHELLNRYIEVLRAASRI
jgi:c-di-GMP-binding flagellar brake protein YcgR